jgi:hypothetical protein
MEVHVEGAEALLRRFESPARGVFSPAAHVDAGAQELREREAPLGVLAVDPPRRSSMFTLLNCTRRISPVSIAAQACCTFAHASRPRRS